jgi:DNA-binding transcriptional LysR family regulator
MINLELYRIFLVVAEAMNITKASKTLCISQPAVTKQIKNLEESIGGALFIRTKKGVCLNEDGKRIYIKIKQALSLVNEAENEFKNLENLVSGTIKIGVSTTLVKKYLSKFIKTYHEQHPNILIEINTDPTSEMIKLLKLGTIDFIIAKVPSVVDGELEIIELKELENIFVANELYKNLSNKRIMVNELKNYPLLLQKNPSNSRDLVDTYFKENNIVVNPDINIASSNLLIDFAKSGFGIGFVTKLYVDEELKRRELFEINVFPKVKNSKLGIIKLKNNELSFASKALISLILKNNN